MKVDFAPTEVRGALPTDAPYLAIIRSRPKWSVCIVPVVECVPKLQHPLHEPHNSIYNAPRALTARVLRMHLVTDHALVRATTKPQHAITTPTKALLLT